MPKIKTHWKIALGYAILIIVLGFSSRLLYVSTLSQRNIREASSLFVQRQDAAARMMYSMLEMNNAERAICLGQTEQWKRFDSTVAQARQSIAQLRQWVKDPRQLLRIDSLRTLTDMKYDNMKRMMDEMAHNQSDVYYYNKVKNLQSGRDSVMVRPKTTSEREDRQTVYEVVKTKKSFLARLADAFHRQRSDTVSVRQERKKHSIDTINHSIDIADTVADVLAGIKREENKVRKAQQESILRRGHSLQAVSVELAQRTQQLLEDIQDNEQRQLRRSLDDDLTLRQSALHKTCLLALLAMLSALVLLGYTYRDMKRERTYREHLEQAKAETERVMAQRERLLLTITHDIKAPAASISGFIELLDESSIDEKARACLNSIRSSASHLLQLVRTLLDYHQLESGRIKPRPTCFNAATLVESCVAERQPQAQTKGLLLRSDTDGCRERPCKADAFRIKQILDNLISNAIKYTDQGQVNVVATQRDGKLLLTVSDTGRGMTQEETQRVFNAFTRLHNAQGTEGVGLGLSIVREVAHLLGGQTQLHSRKGIGTTFSVSIPTAPAHPSDNVPKHATPTADKLKTASADVARKVLIIDDDPLQLQLLREMFARITPGRWNVITCRHVGEALRTARLWHPQLMLADIEMPEMSGTEMIKQTDHSHTAIVGMTAHNPSIEGELREAGFDACLFKPFSLQRLASLLQDMTGEPVNAEATPMEAKPSESRFAPLIAFADHDPQAEREILDQLRQSLQEYMEALAPTASAEQAAMAAHKLLPTATLLCLRTLPMVKSLLPEVAQQLNKDTAESYRQQVTNELSQLKTELNSLLRD